MRHAPRTSRPVSPIGAPPVRTARLVACAAALMAAGLVACQGDFDRPALDNPSDPVLGLLPPTPTVDRVGRICDGETISGMRIEWSIDSEVGVAEYQIFRTTSPDVEPGDLILHVPAGTLEIIDTEDLEEDVVYTYRVRAVDSAGSIGRRSAPLGERADCQTR